MNSRRSVLLVALLLALPVHTSAQSGVSVSGRLLDSVSGEPIAAVTVLLDELRRETASGADGTFTLESIPPGTYHLSVRSPGFSSRRTEVVVGTTTTGPVDVMVDRELHFQEVVTVGAQVRSQFESYQPTSVLNGQELAKRLETSLGATLDGQPGVASRSFGPAPARPVIRGLDGDRVLVLQDGQRMGDISSQSGDHGVTINPAAAKSIEVVRGPATLLYGSNAIGGLVNVLTDSIPQRPVIGTNGNFTFDAGTAAREGGSAGQVAIGNGKVALTLGGGARRTGQVNTPEGEVDNSQSRNGFGTVGLGWTGARSYVGGSYGYDDIKYGIPVVEGGVLQLTPRRHSFSLRSGARNLNGAFDEFRATMAVRRYQHEELEGDEVGTLFKNDTTEAEFMASHRAVGRLKGSVGVWAFDRTFDSQGEEALSPKVGQGSVATFVYEEVTWPHATLQFGGRIDNTRYKPTNEPERSFTNTSGSLGLLVRPPAANERLTIAASVARTARPPALEELFFFGLHHGNFAVELGNPELTSEQALGVDLSLRWRGTRASGEVTFFRNAISNFIFRSVIDEEEFEARGEEFEDRFPGRALVGVAHGHGGAADEEEFPIVNFQATDAVLQGVEVHTDFQLSSTFFAEFGLDMVRGTVTDDDTPLPRMPPFRVRGGLRYQKNAFQAGMQVNGVSRQGRVYGSELPTDGYNLLRLYSSYSFENAGALSTITVRLDNATNTLYRNHLSLIKDLVPEMGRNLRLLYNVRF